MSSPGPIRLVETSPGIYTASWVVPTDTDPGVYELRGYLVLDSTLQAAQPSAKLEISPPPAEAVTGPTGGPPPPCPTEPVTGPAAPAAGGPGPIGGAVAAAPPIFTTYIHQGLRPDLPLWVTPDDQLVVVAKSIIFGTLQLVLSYKLWGPPTIPGLDQDQPYPFYGPLSAQLPEVFAAGQLLAPVPGDGFSHTFQTGLGYGYLVSCAINGIALGVPRGVIYAAVWLVRGQPANRIFYRLLTADYVDDFVGPSWPEGAVIAAENSRGHITNYDGSAPLAGQETTLVQPTGARWRLIHVGARLTTSAVVANRTPSLTVGSFGFGSAVQGTQVVTASTTIEIGWWAGLADTGHTGAQINQWLPSDFALEGGQLISTKTTGLQAGDQWSDMTVLVEELLTDL